MRRSLRIFINALTLSSLLLCVATVVLWAELGDGKDRLALARINNPDTTTARFYVSLAVSLIPYWMVVSATAVLPLTWCAVFAFNQRERRILHRLERHLCPACGYGLYATPDRCPECGVGRTTHM